MTEEKDGLFVIRTFATDVDARLAEAVLDANGIGSISSMASSASIAPSSRTCVIRLSTLPGWMLVSGQRLQTVNAGVVAYIPKMTSGTSPAKDLIT